jgi:WD40 repeat protein
MVEEFDSSNKNLISSETNSLIQYSSSIISRGLELARMTIDIANVHTQELVRVFQGHTERINGVSFSPNSLYVVSASSDKTIRLWDTNSGEEIRRLEGHKGSVNSAVFSTDGRIILSGSDDRTVRVWDVDTGKEIRVLQGHAGAILKVAISPDSKLAYSGSYDDTIRIWDIATGHLIKCLDTHEDVWEFAFSARKKIALVRDLDGSISIWNLDTNTEEFRFLDLNCGDTVAISPDAQYGIFGSADYLWHLWDLKNKKEIMNSGLLDAKIVSTSSTPDDPDFFDEFDYLYSEFEQEADITVVDTLDGSGVTNGFEMDSTSVSADTDEDIYYVENFDFDIEPLVANFISISPLNRFFAICQGSWIGLWEFQRGRHLKAFGGHTGGVTCVDFSPDIRYLLSGGVDSTLRLWNLGFWGD